MEKRRCRPSLTRCPLRGRNCCRPRNTGHKSSSDTHHDEEQTVRSSSNFYSSRHAVHRRLWIPDRRAGDDSPLRTSFHHAVPDTSLTQRLSTQRIRPRGLSATSQTRSQPCVWFGKRNNPGIAGGKMQPTFKRKTFRDARKILNDLCLMLDGKEASSNRSASETSNPDGARESWWLENKETCPPFDSPRS